MSNNAQKPISKRLAELDAAIEWFYGEDFSLDQALDKYQAAVKLAQDIDQDLAKMQNQVEVIADFTKA